MMDGVMYVVTAAADGLIRTWKFDSVANIFEPVGILEGHLRAITCILLHGTLHISSCLINERISLHTYLRLLAPNG